MVRAGFKGHVGGGLAQVGTALHGVPQGHGLGMGFTDALRVPFADALVDTITQPTRGLGSDTPTAWFASSKARAIQRSSAAMSAVAGGNMPAV